MKKIVILFILGITVLSCSVELKSIKYSESKISEGVVYNLPKNLVKIEVSYTVREPYELVNGVEKRMTNSEAIIAIEKPIKVISKLIADKSKSYVLTGDRITNNFFTKSTLDFNLTQDGLLKAIDTDIDDESAEFGEKLIISTGNIAKTFVAPQSKIASQLNAELASLMTQIQTVQSGTEEANQINLRMEELISQLFTLNYDSKLLTQIVILNEEFLSNNNKDSLNIISSKIKHLQSQIEWYQKNNKTFYKSKDIKYTAVIDPFIEYNRDEVKTEKVGTKYSHKIKPKNIFPSSVPAKKIPEIKITLIDNKQGEFTVDDEVNGIVVRHPASTKVDLEVNDNLYGSEIIYLAQLGNISTIPIKSKRAGKVKTTIRFDPTTGAIAQHKIEANSGSSKIGKSLENSTKTIQETIEYLTFEKEIKRLEALKTESQLENEIFDLGNTELSRELSQLELNEKILLLKKKIDELNQGEVEATDFENTVKELEQQQKLLELEVLIKTLKEQIENIGN